MADLQIDGEEFIVAGILGEPRFFQRPEANIRVAVFFFLAELKVVCFVADEVDVHFGADELGFVGGELDHFYLGKFLD